MQIPYQDILIGSSSLKDSSMVGVTFSQLGYVASLDHGLLIGVQEWSMRLMIHILVIHNNIEKFVRSSRPLISKHEIRSLCIRLLAFQSVPIFMFHQGACHNGKALKRGTHEAFWVNQHKFNKLALIFIGESRILARNTRSKQIHPMISMSCSSKSQYLVVLVIS